MAPKVKKAKEKKGLQDLADMPGTAFNDAEVAENRKAKVDPVLPAVQALLDKYKAPLLEAQNNKQAEYDAALAEFNAARVAFRSKQDELNRAISSQKAAVHKSFSSPLVIAAERALPAKMLKAFKDDAAHEKAELLRQVERDTHDEWFPIMNEYAVKMNDLRKKKSDIYADLSDARVKVNQFENV